MCLLAFEACPRMMPSHGKVDCHQGETKIFVTFPAKQFLTGSKIVH